MRIRSLVTVLATGISLVACGSSTPIDERTSKASSKIINGNLDTTHQAVVMLYGEGGAQGASLCSGTIVKTDPVKKIGYVLTAAHCVDIPPALVIQGDDFEKPDAIRYEVIDYTAHPSYNQGGNAGQPYDFAVVRIAGVDENTPVIKIASSPDGVANGTPFVAVGYGRTTLIQSGSNDTNTVRRNVNLTISQVSGSLQYMYNQQSRGVCQGDSGGPDIVGTGASERVIGVHSFIEGDCNVRGGSGRVTGGLNFINQELAKTFEYDCNLCGKAANSGKGECVQLSDKCFADTECKAFYECAAKCTTTACQKTCLTKHPKAEGPFNAVAGCACNRACADQCQGSLSCKGTPKCGYTFPAGDCAACTEGACCQEALDCGADGTCFLCLKSKDAEAECATNETRKRLATCVAKSCKTQCEGSGLENGADPAAEGDGSSGKNGNGTTTTTSSGCAASPSSSTSRAGLGFVAVGLALAAALRRRRR